MFSNPLFETGSRENINESFDTYNENFSFKPPQGEVLLEQARTSINNLMLKFDKPKKGEKKEEEEDDFRLLTESFMINLDKLNASQITMKPLDIDLNEKSPYKQQFSEQQTSGSPIKFQPMPSLSPILLQKSDNFQQKPLVLTADETPKGFSQKFPSNISQQNENFTMTNEIKTQNLETQNKFLEQSLEKLHDDHNHLLSVNEGLHQKIRALEAEKTQIFQKNMDDLANIQSLSQQLRLYQDQTSNNSQEFVMKKQALTLQYEKQIQELKDTIRLNEDLLRKSVNKDTLYEALQVQMDGFQTSNKNLQGQLNEVLNMLDNSKEKFIEKEASLMRMIETLQREVEGYRLKEANYTEELRKLKKIKEFYEENHELNERKLKEYEVLLERKEGEITRYRSFEMEYETMKQGLEKNTHELQDKYYENEEDLLKYRTENQALEGMNKELKHNIEMLTDSLKSLQKKFEDNEGALVEKEMGYRDKYMRIEELYKNSKEIIENYNRQLEDYKMEKELLIKQLFEERSRNQQERMSFSDQKRFYEENMKKYEGGVMEKEHKIKDLMNDLIQKESFIRMSTNDKNQEFERIKNEYFKLLEKKEAEIKEIRMKNEVFSNEREVLAMKIRDLDQGIMDREGVIRSYDRKSKEYEEKMKKMHEENERILRETKEMHQHKTLLLETKIQQLQENFDRLSKQIQGETEIKREYDEKIKRAELITSSPNKSFNPFVKESPEKKLTVQSEIRNVSKEMHKEYQKIGQKDNLEVMRENIGKSLEKVNYNKDSYNYNIDSQKTFQKDNYSFNVDSQKPIQRENLSNNYNKDLYYKESQKEPNKDYYYKDLHKESPKEPKKDLIYEAKTLGNPTIRSPEPSNIKQTYTYEQKSSSNQGFSDPSHISYDQKTYTTTKGHSDTHKFITTSQDKTNKKTDVFIKKETIREEEIVQEVTNLKNEVFEVLKQYQKLLAAIQVKKVSSGNLKKYIGDNLHNIFLNYSKILFIFFKPNENFVNLLNLNLYIDKPEEIKRKIFSKSQYLSFKDIYLQTGGIKEKEINEMMRNCNDFILEFYEFIKRKPENQAHQNKIQPKPSRESTKISELYCGKCNGVFPIEIYRTHITTCDFYKGGKIYEEDVLTKNVSFSVKNQRFSLMKLSEMMGYRINELTDGESKQKVMNLISNVRSLNIDEYREHLTRDVKELINMKIPNNNNDGSFGVLLNRFLTVLENKKEIGVEPANNHLDNIHSD